MKAAAALVAVLGLSAAFCGCDLSPPAVEQPAPLATPSSGASPGVVFGTPAPVRPQATPPEGNPAPG